MVAAAQTKAQAPVGPGRAAQPMVDTRLLGKPRTFSKALTDWKAWRVTFTACAGALSPDMKRLMKLLVDAVTEGQVLNGTTLLCPCHVLRGQRLENAGASR